MITKMGMPYEGLKKTGFTGSHKGMRFFVKSYEEDTITAYVYPEPYSFDKTPGEKKEKEDFPYTKEGVDACIDWLNKMYLENQEKWVQSFNTRNDADKGE